jgi:integrase
MTKKIRGLYWRPSSYYVHFSLSGKEYRISLHTKNRTVAIQRRDKAFADKAAFVAEWEAERTKDKRRIDVWVEEYLHLMRKLGRRDMKEREIRLNAFCKRFPGKALDEITFESIEAWRTVLSDSVSPATVNRYLAAASHMFTEAVRRGLCSKNPCLGVERLQEPKGRVGFLKPEEAIALLLSAEPWLKPMLVIAMNTGMRKGEICNLLRSDLEYGFAHVRHSKNKEARVVPLTETVQAELSQLVPRINHPYLFSGPEGEPLVLNWQETNCEPGLQYRETLMSKALQRACKKAGIKQITFHFLRHHAISMMAMSGIDLDTRMEIAGHKTTAMARKYSHFDPEYLKREIVKLEQAQLPTQAEEAQRK